MPEIYTFEKERIKLLLTLFTNNGAQWDEFPEQFKKPLNLYFHDMVPAPIVGDGFYLIEAVFTKEAVNSFRKNHSHLSLTAMQGKVMRLLKWRFELRFRNRESCFNSYNNLAVYLVI